MNTEKRKLFIVYNRAIAKAKKSPDSVKIVQRLKKAFSILQHHNYYIDEKLAYMPTCSSCNCDDWKYHNAAKRQYRGHCKHMMAEILIERMKMVTYHQTTFQ